LTAVLDQAVRSWPDRSAIDFLGRRTTYGDLGRLVDLVGLGFQRLGVTRGVRVGLCLPNTPYSVICYYAVLKAGGIVVNFNPLYVERELAYQVEDSGTVLMVTVDVKQIYAKVAGLLATTRLERLVVCSMAAILPVAKGLLLSTLKRADLATLPADPRIVEFDRLIAGKGSPCPVEINPTSDIAVLQYTGGTTGVPKGAMLTHANLVANTSQVLSRIPPIESGQERMLGVLPLFHVFAMTVVMNVGLALGAELILLPRFEIEQLMKCLVGKRPTLLPGVPTLFNAINARAADGTWDLSSLRFCIAGGAPLPAEVRSRFERLTGCRVVEGYGLSEASPVVTCNPFNAIRDGSAGLPLAGTSVEIRSLVDRRQLVRHGEKGEVCVRGPQVMTGYWQRPADSAATFIDGSLCTGDIGYVDEDGYLFLVDRLKDVILCGGYNVYPRIIEEALYRHPAVAEAAVIGVPDSYRGESPKAFVRLHDGTRTTPDEIRKFLEGYLSAIEMPKSIELRAELPKTAVGKLSKRQLAEEEAQRSATT
jgi:long-chain acyl-CoA synthetase